MSTLTKSLTVDHRYSPPWWQTLICLPDDPVKTIVGREGQFYMDYGSGGPRNFVTNFEFDLAGGTEWARQDLPDANIPVLITTKAAAGIAITETAFLEIPFPDAPSPKVVRFDGFEALQGWASPVSACDPAFCDAAVRYPSGSHEASLEIHLHVEPGASRTIALGFCEGVQTEPGMRRSIVHAEGAAPLEVDPVRDFGANVPGVHLLQVRDSDGDGRIVISLKFHPDTHFTDGVDRISDLRTIMVSAVWSFVGEAPSAAEIVSGRASATADVYAPASELRLPERRNHLLVKVFNKTDETQTIRPVLRVRGLLDPVLEGDALCIGRNNTVTCSLAWSNIELVGGQAAAIAVERAGIQGTGGSEWTVSMAEQSLCAGETGTVAIVLDRFAARPRPRANPASSARALVDAGRWWHRLAAPQGTVAVPDPTVQRMIDSCVRNIFQARDLRNGLPSFHVGPTIYRGLFLADGAFMLELATMLGRVTEARAGLDYLQSFEMPEGGFNVIDTYYKENGIAIFAFVRHAQLTGDRAWLRTKWQTIRGCVERIRALRRMTPKGVPNEGLLPAGAFCDGGVFNNGRPFGDYSNPAWCLSGLKWACDAAAWLGEIDDETSWRSEYDDFRETFRRAAEKDLTDDGLGNRYLPTVQGNGDHHAPPRGQWAFCHSVHPGGIYHVDDPIALGTLAMLKAALVEGVVLDTGWMSGGLWPYFSSFYSHALQWMGMGHEAPQILYDFANHASPTLVWREEQKPLGHGYEEVGDMPHNWASTEFLRMVVHMLAFDRGDELHLLEGMPEEWAAMAKRTVLNGIVTPFGAIDLDIQGVEAGVRLRLSFGEKTRLPSRIVVHRHSWTGRDVPPVEIPVAQLIDEVVSRKA